jgi:hypothetical protein
VNGPIWRKASRSNTQGNECVEIADLNGIVGVRDSKNTEAGHLVLEASSFGSLISQIKEGELDG